MSVTQFQTDPIDRYLLVLPSDFVEKKRSEWLHALCLQLKDHGRIQISGNSEIQWSDLRDLMIDLPLQDYLKQESKIIILLPANYPPAQCSWFHYKNHRILVYGTEESFSSDRILFSICSGILWMNAVPKELSNLACVSFAVGVRAKTKWKKFISHDWWLNEPSKSAQEFCEMSSMLETNLRNIKELHQQQIELLHSTYREEIQAWSKISTEQSRKIEHSPQTSSNEPEISTNSATSKQLHAQETYIKDLEMRLSRYENQITSIFWHQLKQFVSVFLWRLPLALGLLGYHIFSVFYHRYQSSKQKL